jgi:hypothetical protein
MAAGQNAWKDDCAVGTDRIKALISMTVVPPGNAGSPLQTISVEWDEAVCAAAARLDAGWIMPERAPSSGPQTSPTAPARS